MVQWYRMKKISIGGMKSIVRNSVNIIVCIVWMSVSSVVAAQDTTASKLAYKDAVQIELKNNVTLNQHKNTLYSREIQRNQSIANFLPSVRLRGVAEHSEGQQPNPDGGELQDLKQDFVSADLFAEIGIFNGLNRVNLFSQAASQFKSQSALVERSQQNV